MWKVLLRFQCIMLYFIAVLLGISHLAVADEGNEKSAVLLVAVDFHPLKKIVKFLMIETGCEGVELVSRDEWRARDPVRAFDIKLPANHIIILHTVTRFCKTKPQCIRNIQYIQDMHLDERGWWDIAYSFLVGGDGRIYEGRGWKNKGSFSINFNTNSLGIAFIGNYNKYSPTEAMINATLKFIACGVDKGYLTPIRKIHGHRDVSCTDSPGEKLYQVIRTWDNYSGGRLPLYHCKPLEPPTDSDELDS